MRRTRRQYLYTAAPSGRVDPERRASLRWPARATLRGGRRAPGKAGVVYCIERFPATEPLINTLDEARHGR